MSPALQRTIKDTISIESLCNNKSFYKFSNAAIWASSITATTAAANDEAAQPHPRTLQHNLEYSEPHHM